MSTPTPEQFLAQPYDPDEDLEPTGDAHAYVTSSGSIRGSSVRGSSIIISPESVTIGHLTAKPDPLTSIAESLERIASSFGVSADLAGTAHAASLGADAVAELEQRYRDQSQEYADLEDKHRALYELLAEVEKIVAKSSSKVSLDVKAAINAWRNPVVPEQGDLEGPYDEVTLEHDHEDEAECNDTCPAYSGPEQPVQGLPVPAADAPVEAWRAYARSRGIDVSDRDNRSQIRTALGLPHFDVQA